MTKVDDVKSTETYSFADGKAVRLKSGGPEMTVQFTAQSPVVWAEWKDDHGKTVGSYFSAATLVPVNQPS